MGIYTFKHTIPEIYARSILNITKHSYKDISIQNIDTTIRLYKPDYNYIITNT